MRRYRPSGPQSLARKSRHGGEEVELVVVEQRVGEVIGALEFEVLVSLVMFIELFQVLPGMIRGDPLVDAAVHDEHGHVDFSGLVERGDAVVPHPKLLVALRAAHGKTVVVHLHVRIRNGCAGDDALVDLWRARCGHQGRVASVRPAEHGDPVVGGASFLDEVQRAIVLVVLHLEPTLAALHEGRLVEIETVVPGAAILRLQDQVAVVGE